MHHMGVTEPFRRRPILFNHQKPPPLNLPNSEIFDRVKVQSRGQRLIIFRHQIPCVLAAGVDAIAARKFFGPLHALVTAGLACGSYRAIFIQADGGQSPLLHVEWQAPTYDSISTLLQLLVQSQLSR